MKKIIVFDTDTKRLNFITTALKKENYSVWGFNSLEKASMHIKNSLPDIIFLHIPEGLEAKYLNSFKEVAPVIGIPEKDAVRVIKKAFKSGIEDFIMPPYSSSELKLKVEYCLQKRQKIQILYEKLENEKIHLGKLAITDFLTGLYNTRYLYHRLEEEFSRANRYNIPLTCLMVDIDLFKRINDTYGHKTGDRALKEFAQLLKKNVRKSDILARYGGEEFIILLPNTSKEGSISESERLSLCVRNHKFKSIKGRHIKGKHTLSVSIGAVTYPHKRIKASDDLITFADNALFRAKNKGRGRVVIYS